MASTHNGPDNARDTILLAAAQEFEELGYGGASLNSIAARAGTVKGHVQYYFHAKADIATTLVQNAFAGGAFLTPSPGGVPLRGVTALLATIKSVSEHFRDSVGARAAIRLLSDRAQIPAPLPPPYVGWMGRIEGTLQEACDDGEIRADTDPKLWAWLLIASFSGAKNVSESMGALEEFPGRAQILIRALLCQLGWTPTAERESESIEPGT